MLIIIDTFELWRGLTNITLKDKDISWPRVSGTKYKRSVKSHDEQWIDPENGNFLNLARFFNKKKNIL